MLKVFCFFSAAVFALGCTSLNAGKVADADSKAERSRPEVIYPETAFDPAQAAKLMGKGNLTIKGVVYNTLSKYGTQHLPGGAAKPRQTPAGIKVFLYPATPHLVEWQKNDAKQRSGWNKTGFAKLANSGKRPKIYKFDDRMLNYRYTAIADEFGRFEFTNMLPGRYYFFSEATINGSFVGTEVIGRTTVVNGAGYGYSTEDTRPAEHTWSTYIRGDKFLEVRSSEAIAEVELKMKAPN